MVYHQSGPGDIEITSYVLLTYNILKQFSKGRELLLWLQRNQNGIGGFSSTQVGIYQSVFVCNCGTA